MSTEATPPPPEAQAWRGLPWKALAAVSILALGLQIAVTANVVLLPDYDEAIYWDVSRNCLRTGLFYRSYGESGTLFFDHPPLFLYLASPIFLFTDDIAGFRGVVSLTSLLAVFLTAWLASSLAGPWAALPAALILAFNPLFLFYGNSAYQDVPFCLPVLAGTIALLRARPVLSGLLVGAAFLVKYFGAGFAGCFAAYLYFTTRSKGQAGRFLLAFTLVASLWPLAGLAVQYDSFVDKLAYWEEYLNPKTAGTIQFHPLMPAVDYAQTLYDRLTAPHAALLAAGLLWGLFRMRSAIPGLLLILGTSLAYLATLFGIFLLRGDRYLVPILPFLAILASSALAPLGHRGRYLVVTIVAVAGLLIPMPGSSRLPFLARPQYGPAVHRFAEDSRAAARRVQQLTRETDVIAVDWNGPRYGYLCRRNYTLLYPAEDPQDLRRRLGRAPVVVRDHESGRWHLPGLGDEEIALWEEELARDFTVEDFGRVRVYARRSVVTSP